MRVDQAGGIPSPVTRLDAAKGEYSHAYPFFLPDGKHFLFTILAAHPDNAGLFVGSLDSPKLIRLLTETTVAQYTAPGFILYARGNALMARPFDARRLRLGEALLVAEGLGDVAASSAANFSATGRVLVYHTGGDATDRLTWFDRKGARLGDLGPAGSYMQPEISPDGRAVALTELDAQSGKQDTWIFDLARSTHSRLTLEGGVFTPVWSPDGRRIVFAHGGAHYMKAANGAGQAQLVDQLPPDARVTNWTADGRYLVFDRRRGDQMATWALPLFGGRKPFPLVAGPHNASFGQVSPDGQWIAYVSEATGQQEVFVESFPPAGGKWQISTHGSSGARWRKDGRELFYLQRNRLMAVDVSANSGGFAVSVPRQLFEERIKTLTRFSVSNNGQRFLFVTPAERPEHADPLTVVLNWTAAVKH